MCPRGLAAQVQGDPGPLTRRLRRHSGVCSGPGIVRALDVYDPRRFLEAVEKIGWRKRYLRGPDRLATGIEQRAPEHVRIAECKAQGHACATGEAADVDVLRIDGVALRDVVFG